MFSPPPVSNPADGGDDKGGAAETPSPFRRAHNEFDPVAARRLWNAVLLSATADAFGHRGDLANQKPEAIRAARLEALAWFSTPSCQLVCELANQDPEALRRRVADLARRFSARLGNHRQIISINNDGVHERGQRHAA